MERTEWPNKARLEELRDEGVVHFSPVVTRAAGLLSFLCVVYGFKADIASLVAVASRWLAAGGLGPLPSDDRAALIRLLVLPPLAALLASFFFAWAQTRFLFRPGLLALTWKRLYVVNYSPLSVLGRVLGAVLLGAAALAAGAGLAVMLQRDVLVVLNNGPRYLAPWASSLVLSLLPVALVAAVALLATWWAISKIFFLRAHRLTRREAQQYQRED